MIFLDMDGVLCDFVSAAFRAHGKEFCSATYPKGEYRIERVLGVTYDQFWVNIDGLGNNFWPTLKPYSWMQRLVAKVFEFDSEVKIATSPSENPNSWSGKQFWLRWHGLGHIRAKMGDEKWLLAAPGRCLIDDSDENVNEFRAAGGDAILFPQPWNSGTSNGDLVDHVSKQLRDLGYSR